MDPNCPKCQGTGWVCENHPDIVWSDEWGCQCGAGMICQCSRLEFDHIEAERQPDSGVVHTVNHKELADERSD